MISSHASATAWLVRSRMRCCGRCAGHAWVISAGVLLILTQHDHGAPPRAERGQLPLRAGCCSAQFVPELIERDLDGYESSDGTAYPVNVSLCDETPRPLPAWCRFNRDAGRVVMARRSWPDARAPQATHPPTQSARFHADNL